MDNGTLNGYLFLGFVINMFSIAATKGSHLDSLEISIVY
jgi:hypothetical protein